MARPRITCVHWLPLLAAAICLPAIPADPFGVPRAFAQQAESPQAAPEDGEARDTPSQQPRTLPPAYEDQLLRLSEVLGALHYLRTLCGANEGQTWREEMQNLIAAEQPDAQARARMVSHFNRGFRGYAEIHRECNDAAIQAANDFLVMGTRLAAEIPNRYGR